MSDAAAGTLVRVSQGQLTQRELDVLRFMRGRATSTDAIAAAVFGLPQTNFGRQANREASRLLGELKGRRLVEARPSRRPRWQLTSSGRAAIAEALER